MKRIVIIDDDDIFLFLSSKAIENVGLTDHVQKFNDGEEGLKYLIDETGYDTYPTVLMVDINMPMTSGWEIVETLEKEKWELAKECKTFILSSSIDVMDKEKALSYKSVAGFIIKPLSESHLRQIALEHFGRD